MFSAWSLLAHHPIDSASDHRPPPPPATPLDFPAYQPPEPQLPTRESSAAFFKALQRATRPDCVRSEILDPANLRVTYDVPLEDFLPEDPASFGDESMETDDAADTAVTSDGQSLPQPKFYNERRVELLHSNDAAFGTVHRTPGLFRLRLGSFHQFYLALSDMANYWDISGDKYFEIEDNEKKGLFRQAYTGHRIGSGRNMPESIRERCARSFVEPIAWAFQLRINLNTTRPQQPPQPRLILRKSAFFYPRCPTHYIYRSSSDRAAQKTRLLEGPVFAMHFRGETFFRHKTEPEGQGKGETTDALKDLFCALVTAQVRDREGKTEDFKRGWWTDRPKWGGAPPPEPAKDGPDNAGLKSAKRVKHSIEIPQNSKQGGADILPNLDFTSRAVPPSDIKGSWDPNTTYKAIGRDSEHQDSVYMVNALNHHISFSRYKIRAEYLAFLENGSFPASTAPDNWYILDLSRTKWYDLFKPEERAEAFKALWGILKHLTTKV